MDFVTACKDKLTHFRIKELKDVLSQLGLAKQGKKQDLVDRILTVLSDEQASKTHGWAKKNSIGKESIAKIIDDTYRKMQIPGANDLASMRQSGHSGPEFKNMKLKEEVHDSVQLEVKVRCPCGSTLPAESMIQCEDRRCRVWQHMACVIIPEKPMDGFLQVPPVPPQFYCEVCRISRADPNFPFRHLRKRMPCFSFWVTLAHPLRSVKLMASNIPTDGTNPVLNVDKTFKLTRADRDLLQTTEHDVQAWCILLNDKVPFRMQWPQYAELQVNGVPVRTTNRPGSQVLGANGRDDGPTITTCTREGVNKIVITGCDARLFCFGVRIVRRWTVQQVLNLIPKEIDGELFEDALARVRRCTGGGNATDNADSDSDLEVVADSTSVSLRCPLSGSRIRIAGRFKPCAHMGCFDLEAFVEINQRARKWQCPICLKNYSLEHVIIDPYFNRITTMMRDCGEDVTDIDVKPDGAWRVKHEDGCLDLAEWHSPDGSLCVTAEVDVKPNIETLKQVKPEGGSEGHTGLKLGIRKNRNGIWEVSKAEMHSLSSGNRIEEKFTSQSHNVMPMSSSATGSYRDGEDASVNQDGCGRFELPSKSGNELDSVPLNYNPAFGIAHTVPSAPAGNEGVIVLSDSDDENENPLTISPEAVHGTCQGDVSEIMFPAPLPGLPESYPGDPAVHTDSLGVFNNNIDEMELPLWPSDAQAGSGFQLFGSEDDVSDILADLQNTSSHTPTNGYALPANTNVGCAQVPYSMCTSSTNINNGLADSPLAFGGDDPSLQIFLPSCPSGASPQVDLRDQPDNSNGVRAEDWISLRLGGSGGNHGESAAANGISSRDQPASKESNLDSLANASLLLSMNDHRSERTTTSKQHTDGPFSYPRQPRSVRPRLYLSIDSDSD